MNKFDLFDDYSTKGSTIPLPNENFDQLFLSSEANDMEFLFNETLMGLQDLDVPSGYGIPQNTINNDFQHTPNKSKSHSRQYSGTAIFGFADHNKDLSINGVNNDLCKQSNKAINTQSVSPGELLKRSRGSQTPTPTSALPDTAQDILDFNFEEKPILLLEEDELEEEKHKQQQRMMTQLSPLKRVTTPSQSPFVQQPQTMKQRKPHKKTNEYIVANENPNSYKFPPSPSPTAKRQQYPPSSPIPYNPKSDSVGGNSYSAKYLQSLNKTQQIEYVDDIEPLLQEDNNNMKYIPIPVQEPMLYQKQKPVTPPLQSQNDSQQLEPLKTPQPQPKQQQQQQQPNNEQDKEFTANFNFNTFLPPPTPPNLINGSPDWNSSPEPYSPSPGRLQPPQQISPIHQNLGAMGNNINFYTPMYYELPVQAEQPQPQPQPHQQQHQQQQHQPELQNTYQQIKHIQQQQQMLQHQFHNQNNQLRQQHPNQFQNQNQNQNQNQTKTPYSQQSQFSPTHSNFNLSPAKQLNSNVGSMHLSPLKKQLPNTPTKQPPVTIEWSPVISPNSKQPLHKQIKESSPRRRIKKTSLLPPGELDNYWTGPDEDKIYTCTYKNCGKKFTRRYNVRSHIQTHLSDRPFGCQFCPKRFVRQHDLNRHVKGHIEARYSKCPCGKEFARLDALRKHQDRNICVGGNKNVISKPTKKKGTNNTQQQLLKTDTVVERIEKQLLQEDKSVTEEFLMLQ